MVTKVINYYRNKGSSVYMCIDNTKADNAATGV